MTRDAARNGPSPTPVATHFFDTSESKHCVWNGKAWEDFPDEVSAKIRSAVLVEREACAALLAAYLRDRPGPFKGSPFASKDACGHGDPAACACLPVVKDLLAAIRARP